MLVKNLFLLLFCFCLLESTYGQEVKTNVPFKKLEFKEGIPGELQKFLKNISADNCSYAEINMDVAADILYIILYNAPDGIKKYYRVRKSELDSIIRFEFTKDKGIAEKIKIIEYDEDESYDYYIVLVKSEENISYTIENIKNIELGFIGEVGVNYLADENNPGLKNSGREKVDRSLSGIAGLQLSVKSVINTSHKAEFRIGTSELNDNWGFNVGFFFHKKIKTNFYAAAGLSIKIKSEDAQISSKSKNAKLAHVMPTISLVHYLGNKTYFMSSFFLDFNDNAEYYNKESRWGVKIGLGVNIF